MTTLYERVMDEIAHFDRPTDRALRAAVALHEPEQHWTIGPGHKRTPSRQYCRACRATAPCAEILAVAAELGVADGGGGE